MNQGFLLEVAANSVASAAAAQEGGAGRVELCTALELGGLTPSMALIAMVRECLHIPLYVLIRARAGDFLYNDLECELMRRDIETCAALGCDGVVLGVLDAEGDIDKARCRTLIQAAGEMGITFHRAFDMTRNPQQSLEDIIMLGCERVLTSGAQASAVEGAPLIRKLIMQATGRIAVMPGAGVTPQNIAALAKVTGASEFHASAKQQLVSGMRHQRPVLHDMEGGELRSDARQVRELADQLHHP